MPRDPDACYMGVRSGLWAALRKRFPWLPGRDPLLRHETDFRLGFAPESRKWRTSRAALMGIAADCRAISAELIVASLPGFGQPFDHTYPYRQIHERVRSWCRECSVAVVDLLPRFAGCDHRPFQVPGESHPNAEAYGIIAGVLHPLLARSLHEARDGKANGSPVGSGRQAYSR
ncbi:MAG: hypothetical protein GF330_03495 [Candidatus Eisenbacteria bacterium]|nr:hypothetical protein [Candidatus Eisenbacteria bacterium]